MSLGGRMNLLTSRPLDMVKNGIAICKFVNFKLTAAICVQCLLTFWMNLNIYSALCLQPINNDLISKTRDFRIVILNNVVSLICWKAYSQKHVIVSSCSRYAYGCSSCPWRKRNPSTSCSTFASSMHLLLIKSFIEAHLSNLVSMLVRLVPNSCLLLAAKIEYQILCYCCLVSRLLSPLFT